jgi:hypothetical protein
MSEREGPAHALRVAGHPTLEELAAVIAALTANNRRDDAPTGYRLWRQTRLRSLAS